MTRPDAAPGPREAELTRRLEEMAPGDALAILAGLSSALFPGGAGELHQVTWEPVSSPPLPVGSPRSAPAAGHRARDDARLRAAELRYRTLVEQIPAVTFMAVLGEGENEVYVSPHIETLLGFTQEEWLEDPFLWYNQLHPDDRGLWIEEFARGIRTGGPFSAECRLIARDGRIVWVRGEARLIKDELGRPLFLQGVAFDITESKRAQERVLRQAVRRTEERYRDLVERLGAIFWEAEASTGRFTFVSRGSERILGFSPERWLQDPEFWISRVHDEDREEVRAAWQRALLGGRESELEFRATTADGRLVWLHSSMHFPGGEAEDARPLGVILDITERRRWEEQLASSLASEQAARAEAEALNRVGRSVAAELDLQQLMKQIADVGAELTGAEWAAFCRLAEEGTSYEAYVRHGRKIPHARVVRRSPDDLLAPTFTAATVRLEDLQDPGREGPRQTSLFENDPVRSFLGVPVVSRSAEVLGGLFFGDKASGRFTEAHARVIQAFATQAAIAVDNARLYDTAESARKTAETANRLKDEFLATMSHELRTPVNAVLGWSEILETGAGDDDMRDRAVAAIRRNARAQAQIIEDLLDVSRIVTGKLHLAIEQVDLATLVEGALETITLAADAKQIELRTEITDVPARVLGDSDRLRQVVTNLLTNAVKFTPGGGRVTVSVEVDERHARIRVADTGEGMDSEFLPEVFDRFRQADASSTRQHGGLGLGLAIVRHLTEMHGGRVRAESPGRNLGSTFTIELPRDRTDGTAEPEREGAEDAVRLLRDARVLVVDDDSDSLDVMTAFLARAGSIVSTATSAGEARDLLRRRSFDLLLCDIAMPGEDGYALMRYVRTPGSRNEHITAVAVTAYGREEDRRRALAAGFQAHLVKPLDIQMALAAIGRVLSDGSRR